MPNRILSLHTTRSWDFLRVSPRNQNGILSTSRAGSGTIIGIMDTGSCEIIQLRMLYILLNRVLMELSFFILALITKISHVFYRNVAFHPIFFRNALHSPNTLQIVLKFLGFNTISIMSGMSMADLKT